MNFQDELELLIRARYPILNIISNEETRVRDAVVHVANKRRKKVFEWSCTTGITFRQAHPSNPTNSTTPPPRTPLAALDHVINQVEPAIFVFNDFHPFLTRSHFAIVRKLKEIALHLKDSVKTIVLVSAVMEFPQNWRKEIHGAQPSFAPTREDDLRRAA